jgi:hypothetical protein
MSQYESQCTSVKDLLMLHIQNLHKQLGIKWYHDTEADVAAIIKLLKAEIKEEVMNELQRSDSASTNGAIIVKKPVLRKGRYSQKSRMI